MLRLALTVAALASPARAFRGTSTDLAAASTLRAANAAAGIPLPSLAQLKGALAHPFTIFLHYSMCTYTGCQWNTAVSPATNFTPPDAGPNATQWAATIKSLGATQVCLTVRHVGGFTLWDSATTNYSVAGSGWRGGRGDVVADFVAAMRAAGLSPCLYVILGFNVEANHSGVPGPVYLDRQVAVLTELLTNYGDIDRLWWDNYAIGCCQPVTHEGLYCPGGGTTSTPSAACPGWSVLIDTVRAFAPATAVVPGPDGCLVNGETLAGTYPLYHATAAAQNSYTCTDAAAPFGGPFFAVMESDFSLTIPGWFWNSGNKGLNASQVLAELSAKLDQGANMIMNVPPNEDGVIEADFADTLARVGAARAATFGDARAALAAPVSAACAALSITLPVNGSFDTLLITEDLVAGQVIGSYSVEALDAGGWRPLRVHGKTVGTRLVDAVGAQAGVSALRLNCSSDLAPPPGPPAPPAASLFRNAAGACMAPPDNETFPCYSGGAGPFELCPLVAASCGARAAWAAGAGGAWRAPGVAADAVLNVDCDGCAAGTHAKVIRAATCPGCGAALTFNESAGAIQVDACPGMCLSDGVAGGARASCAGDEPWSDNMVHLVPCAGAGRGAWARGDAPPPRPVATVAFFGAFLARGVA